MSDLVYVVSLEVATPLYGGPARLSIKGLRMAKTGVDTLAGMVAMVIFEHRSFAKSIELFQRVANRNCFLGVLIRHWIPMHAGFLLYLSCGPSKGTINLKPILYKSDSE